MLARLLVTSVWVASLSACSLANAALYEFTLTGEVTLANWPSVNVGDPFTLRYMADSQDRNPVITMGGYAATSAVVTLPNTTIRSLGQFTGVRVDLNITHGDVIRYSSTDESPYDFYARLEFPGGTLGSDALPLTLPLESAESTLFFVWQFGPEVRGTITSYVAVEVPEPSEIALLALLAPLLLHRRSFPASGSHGVR